MLFLPKLIICNDGTWGLCYEHSSSEGIAVIQLLEGILNKINEMIPVDEGGPQNHLPPPERLEWKISSEFSSIFRTAAINVDRYCYSFCSLNEFLVNKLNIFLTGI